MSSSNISPFNRLPRPLVEQTQPQPSPVNPYEGPTALEMDAEMVNENPAAQATTNPIEEFSVTVNRMAIRGVRSYGPEDKIPKPSYWEYGLVLPCYYMAEHDYYLAWHKEAGLRVISGRYAHTQQKPLDGSKHLLHTFGLQNVTSIPLHLCPKKDWVVRKEKVSANVSVTTGKWDVVEVTETEFKEILKAKPSYKSLLRTFSVADPDGLPLYDKYAYKVVLDTTQVTRIW